jgi:hypothetical protein
MTFGAPAALMEYVHKVVVVEVVRGGLFSEPGGGGFW